MDLDPVGATDIDVGEPGPSVGDYTLIQEDLYDATETTIIGAGNVQCTINFGGDYCVASYTIFGRGELVSEGQLPVPGSDEGIEAVLRDPANVLAVTGGTGDFEDMHGETHLGRTFIFHLFR